MNWTVQFKITTNATLQQRLESKRQDRFRVEAPNRLEADWKGEKRIQRFIEGLMNSGKYHALGYVVVSVKEDPGFSDFFDALWGNPFK